MISSISLRNFKLHASSAVVAAPITVFIGPNNSGKSSVFQSLVLLKQAASAQGSHLTMPSMRQNTSPGQPFLYGVQQYIDVGNFEQIVRAGGDSLQIEVTGSFTNQGVSTLPKGGATVQFSVTVVRNELVNHQGSIAAHSPALGTNPQIGWNWLKGQRLPQATPAWAAPGVVLRFESVPQFTLLRPGSVQLQQSLPNERILALNDVLQLVGTAPERLINTIHPIYSIRGLEETAFPLTDQPPTTSEMMCIADRTVALLSLLAYDTQLQERLAAWVEELVGIRIKVVLLPNRRVALLSDSSAGKMRSFSNEGTGSNQLPFILVPIGLTPPSETLFLSEPEAHLHPRAQVSLTALLLEVAQRDDRQLFIETHSEHVLHAILYAVATGKLRTSDLAIYSFKNSSGTAEVTKLGVDEKGRVDGGLPGFFDQNLAELSDYLEALKRS